MLGYGRIILLLAAMYFMSTHYLTASVLYMTSSLLDEFDGRAARKFNQGKIPFRIKKFYLIRLTKYWTIHV